MVHLIFVAVTGLIAGLIADRIMKRSHGVIVNIIIGIAGAWIGGFLVGLIHLQSVGTGLVQWLFEVAVASVGAVVLLFVLGLFTSPRSR